MYNIPNMNPYPNTPATTMMISIISAKPYNIPVTNTFQDHNQTNSICYLSHPNTTANQTAFTIIGFK